MNLARNDKRSRDKYIDIHKRKKSPAYVQFLSISRSGRKKERKKEKSKS